MPLSTSAPLSTRVRDLPSHIKSPSPSAALNLLNTVHSLSPQVRPLYGDLRPEDQDDALAGSKPGCAPVQGSFLRGVSLFPPALHGAFSVKYAVCIRCGAYSIEAVEGTFPVCALLFIARSRSRLRCPPHRKRRVVLATSIAESSLTIPGVRAVVDAGLSRTSAFDVQSGLTRLVTNLTSQASADQRAGRAGRLGPGRCYRLYTSLGQSQRQEQTAPEISGAHLRFEKCGCGDAPRRCPGAIFVARSLDRKRRSTGPQMNVRSITHMRELQT